MDKTSAIQFLQKFQLQAHSQEEQAAFHEWLLAAEEQDVEAVAVEYEKMIGAVAFPAEPYDRLIHRIETQIDKDQVHLLESKKMPFVHWLSAGGYRKWVAAAAVIMMVSAGGYFWFNRNTETADTGASAHMANVDISAGGNKAILRLADGSTIALDSMQNGVVAQQQHTTVVLQDGAIRYNATGASVDATAFNTMIVPRGRQYRITLPDGSEVWLNAASSIRYPVAFVADQRVVELTGEAYFSVKKDADKPFHVKVNNKIEVEVVGTEFNVNAYENEQQITTTLLEGSVKVLNAAADQPKWTTLQPGQQSLSNSQRQVVLHAVDTDKTIAWKNGLFNFNGAGLHEVMRQLERWYDIEVEYEGKIPDMKFEGKITRGVSLKGVLSGLEKSEVRFRLEGRKLIVKP